MDTPATATPDAQSAGTSPAPVTADAVMGSMTSKEMDSWAVSGELPERVQVTTKGAPLKDDNPDSSPATPAKEQAASTDAKPAPASETGTPETPKKKGAEARNQQLDAEVVALQEKLRLRKALRDELAALDVTPAKKSDEKKAESSPAAWDGSDPRDPKPQDVDYETHEAYLDARDAWNERRVTRKVGMERHAADQQRALEDISRTASERIDQYAKTDPEFISKVDPALLEVPIASAVRASGGRVGPQHVLAELVAKSDSNAQLLMHFSTEAGQQEWARLCTQATRNPEGLYLAFGRLEATFSGSRVPATGGPSPAKHVSTAPTPATTLGSRASEALDPVESAIKSKDMTRYVREMNKRDLAASL